MAWNESGNGKNPWDSGGNEGPPDLDKIVRDWQRRFNSLFGGKGGNRSGSGGSGGSGSSNGPSGAAVVVIAVVVVLGWLASGLYRVNADERGVVLVASAGNERVAELLYPAAYDMTISVGSIDKQNEKSQRLP